MNDLKGTASSEIVEHKLFKVRVEMAPAIASDELRKLLSDGSYEHIEGTILVRALAKGRTHNVLEIGGGIGIISSLLCARCKVRRYNLIEANPELIPVIKRTHELNRTTGVTVQNAMVTSHPNAIERGSSRFNIARSFQASSVRKLDPKKLVRQIRVPVISLAELIDECCPDVLIVDIEGAETDLFGPLDTLGSVRLISLELHPKIIGLPGVSKIFAAMTRLSFAYATEFSRGRIVTFRRFTTRPVSK